ncbi:LysR family transcriptional regulator [Neptunicoccus cionae]|uniref:Transcriptional regulator n=1 Tax=Neptunicoccus cionae TaxID=2035344 RepID=A0A916VQM3_9RHOB|nr:LysR family transcriptional regulator [Amylibacter cionae]GGA21301.1 transcriptional regulator [Amylibacter cionae]
MIDSHLSMIAFAVVADHNSVKAGAQALGFSESKTSDLISNLEDRLGKQLLIRRARSFELTTEGQRIYQTAREMMEIGSEGLETLTGDRGARAQVLRLDMPVFLSGGILREVVQDFLLAHPTVSIELNFEQDTSEKGLELFNLVVSSDSPTSKDISFRKIEGTGAAFYAAPDLAERVKATPIREIPSKIPILLGTDFSASEWAKLFYHGAGSVFPAISYRIKCDDIGLVHNLCRCGAGLAILPKSRVGQDLVSGRLVRVLEELPVQQLEFFAQWRKNNVRLPLIQTFLDHIDDRLNRMRAEIYYRPKP